MPETKSSFQRLRGWLGGTAIMMALAVIFTLAQGAAAGGYEDSVERLVTPSGFLTAVPHTVVPLRTATPTPTRRFQVTLVPYRTATPKW